MNDNPFARPTPTLETVSPSFALEYSSPTCPPPEIPEGMSVWQIRAALAGVHGGEQTNVVAVWLNLGEPTRLEFEIDGDTALDQFMSGYRTRGMTVDQLQQWFANPLVGDGDLTDVAEIEDLGPGWRHFSGSGNAEDVEFRIEGGNSSTGTSGFVAYIWARSPAKALKRLVEEVEDNCDALSYEGFGVQVSAYIRVDARQLKVTRAE
jgi:hypothetical protein